METSNSRTPPAANRRASSNSNQCENKPGGDTADCTAQRTHTVPVPVLPANEYYRNRQSNYGNKETTNKSSPGASTATTKGFYNISENFGFKLDRDLVSSDFLCGENNSSNKNNEFLSSVSENGDHYSKIDSTRDLNKCDPVRLEDYYENLGNTLNGKDESDAEDSQDFVIKSHVQTVDPNPCPTNTARIHTSTAPPEPFFSPSKKTRSSSHLNTTPFSAPPHLQHHHHQHHHPQPAPVSSLNLTLNLPQRAETITQGFGVKMVATASCQQLMYRSVPPRPLSYTLTDVLEPKGSTQRSKTAPVSVNSPDDYVQRFKSRPTTRPRVVEFDGSTVSSKTKKMAMVSSGFPTSRAKIYIGHTKAMSPTQQGPSQTARSSGSKLQLAPLDHSGRRSTPGFSFTPGSPRTMRTAFRSQQGKGAGSVHGSQTAGTRAMSKSAGSSIPDHGTKSTISYKPSTTTQVAETIQSAEFSMTVPRAPTPDPEDHIHNPDLLLTSNSDCDDLSILPRPKKVLPKRELPWVFRYKVKKGMNTLSRIMASKPPPNALHTNYTLT